MLYMCGWAGHSQYKDLCGSNVCECEGKITFEATSVCRYCFSLLVTLSLPCTYNAHFWQLYKLSYFQTKAYDPQMIIFLCLPTIFVKC